MGLLGLSEEELEGHALYLPFQESVVALVLQVELLEALVGQERLGVVVGVVLQPPKAHWELWLG